MPPLPAEAPVEGTVPGFVPLPPDDGGVSDGQEAPDRNGRMLWFELGPLAGWGLVIGADDGCWVAGAAPSAVATGPLGVGPAEWSVPPKEPPRPSSEGIPVNADGGGGAQDSASFERPPCASPERGSSLLPGTPLPAVGAAVWNDEFKESEPSKSSAINRSSESSSNPDSSR